MAVGLWLSLADAYSAEILSRSGLDWLLIDAEHAPNTLTTVLAQLQSTQGGEADIVVRAPCDAPWMLKQLLDIGARTVMVPMIDTPEQAADLVRSVRYPPAGRRGVATSTSRASRFGRDRAYLAEADAGIFLIAQIESPDAVRNIGGIASTPGIDALFIGPADLSASMGHLGDVAHPEVQAAIAHSLAECREAGVPAGIFAGSPDAARRYAGMGAAFVALGSDIGLLVSGADRLAAEARKVLRPSA